MKKSTSINYRDLADWSKSNWINLDIQSYVTENSTRYHSHLLNQFEPHTLPSTISYSLPGIFHTTSLEPLKKTHQRHLNEMGNRRNQIMLGTLKKITLTRVKAVLIKEFQSPSFIYNDNELDRYHYTPDFEDNAAHPTSIYYAAESLNQPVRPSQTNADIEDIKIQWMLENIRGHLTPTQYQHIKHILCDGLDANDIAAKTGRSVTNVRTVLQKARKKMYQLTPDHLRPTVLNCLYRNCKIKL